MQIHWCTLNLNVDIKKVKEHIETYWLQIIMFELGKIEKDFVQNFLLVFIWWLRGWNQIEPAIGTAASLLLPI